MPNHCENTLGVLGQTEDITEFINFISKGDDIYEIFKSLKPMPEELIDTTFPQVENEELKSKYGSDNWYDWCAANWGTKWGDYETQTSGIEHSSITRYSSLEDGTFDFENSITELTGESSVHFNYQTAWAAGEECLGKLLSEQFPKLTFWLYYEEPGMCFAGELRIYKGNIVYNEGWDFHPKYDSVVDIDWSQYESDSDYYKTKELKV